MPSSKQQETTTTTQQTVIAAGTRLKGEMQFEGSATVLGEFEGQIAADGILEIGRSGICRASIEAGVVIIEGTVEGNVVGRDTVEIRSTGRVDGDVTAGTLVMAAGASFEGQMSVGGGAPEVGESAETEPAVSRPAVAPEIVTRAKREPVASVAEAKPRRAWLEGLSDEAASGDGAETTAA
ncbi:MAG: polymer-forming cytoskeletal protein [Planctomycetota bacterium]